MLLVESRFFFCQGDEVWHIGLFAAIGRLARLAWIRNMGDGVVRATAKFALPVKVERVAKGVVEVASELEGASDISWTFVASSYSE